MLTRRYSGLPQTEFLTARGLPETEPLTLERLFPSSIHVSDFKARFMHDLKTLSFENAIERYKGKAREVERSFDELSSGSGQR
jgi:hypothetical protein